MIRYRESRGQGLVKVGQTWSNLIDGPKTTGLGETRFMGRFFCGLLGIGIVDRKCQWRNNFEIWWTSC